MITAEKDIFTKEKENKKILLELKDISKYFGDVRILDDISFYVEENEIIGLIGRSGAGKTTLLRILIGFYKATKGKILYKGEEVSDKNKFLSQVGYVTQENCFYDELTVMENIRYYGELYDVPSDHIKTNAEKLLRFLKLSGNEEVLAKKLSGGMKRRLDFACAMIHNPKILIMDEPTTGLDPVLRKEFWKLIRHIKESDRTIIFSSHLLSELEGLCEKVAIMDKGTVISFGDIETVKERFSKNSELHLESNPGNYREIVRHLRDETNIEKVVLHKHKLVMFIKDPHRGLKEIMPVLDQMGEQIIDIDINKPTLTEVFEFYMEADN